MAHKSPKLSVKASVKEKGVKPSHLTHLHTAFLRVVARGEHKSPKSPDARVYAQAREVANAHGVKSAFVY